MITLYGFGPGLSQPDLSPFVMKVMALLRMSGLPFRIEHGLKAVRGAPFGKLPYIRDGETIVADSRFIRRYLEDMRGIDFTGGYDRATLAQGHFIERTLEEGTYFAALHRRWAQPSGWPILRQAAFGTLPFPLSMIVPPLARRSVVQSLMGQGTGRLPVEKIEALAIADFEALALFLADKPYLLGERPSAPDATVLAFLTAALEPAFPGPMLDALRRHANLVAYRDRLAPLFLTSDDKR
ncbi:MAG: hypothetical protein RLZZ444_120 [Pseudomonadota bacterium]|jgi:glutathione S-transferase